MLCSPLLDDVAHGFTGRAEGDLRGDAGVALVAALGGTGDLFLPRQVHGATVIDASGGVAESDAVISRQPGQVIGVRVADCVPILLAAPGGVVAAVHAGWRGTAAGIGARSVEILCAAVGCPPGALRAAVGPAICGRCYEVGPEVHDAVARVTPDGPWRVDDHHVDLALANGAILRALGVQVDVLGVCTRCQPGYWSHRRDGADAGRQAGVIRCG